MPYQEWWSVPEACLSVARLRRVIALSMKVDGLRAGVGYIPGQPVMIGPMVEEGRLDLYFSFEAGHARALVEALDPGLAVILAEELAELELEHESADDGAAVVALSLHVARDGWDAPRMLLAEDAADNRAVWPVACGIAHVLAQVLGARLLDPVGSWPSWDPRGVLTQAS